MEKCQADSSNFKQIVATSSTMEAEYVACYETTCHTILLRNFVSTLQVVDSISRPLKLYYDNSIALSLSKNTRSILSLSIVI